jgi:hypothetical protein
MNRKLAQFNSPLPLHIVENYLESVYKPQDVVLDPRQTLASSKLKNVKEPKEKQTK